MTEISTDEVGPPPIEDGILVSELVRRLNAAGVALDQVSVVVWSAGGPGYLCLDWAKDVRAAEQLDDEKRAAAEAEAAELERVQADSLEGW